MVVAANSNAAGKAFSNDLRNQSIYALWQAEHAMRLAIDTSLGELGISLPQFGTLTWLSQEPGLSTADLARLNRVSPQNMGMAVTRLLSLGYIERTPPRRGRVAELRLSEKGANVLAAAAGRVAQVQERMLSDLSAAEREALPGILTRCRKSLVQDRSAKIIALEAADD
ncbi:MAG: MarR family winged helix-turn-helix transcriptional regulator [Chloroflexota bacterium]